MRQATRTDVDALVMLMHDFYLESNHPLDRQWAASSFHSLLANRLLGDIWLVHFGLEPAGHAVLTVRYTMEFGGLSGYIDDLYVKPQFRRLGAGYALLSALVAGCRSRACKSIQVEVGDSNAPALALCSKFGLKPATDGRVLLSGTLPVQNGSTLAV